MADTTTEKATTTAKRKVTKTVAATAVEKKKRFCVYLGPSIRGVIQNGAVYRGEKADVLKELEKVITKFPEVRYLVVADDDVATDRVRVKTAGNLLNVKYNQLASGK